MPFSLADAFVVPIPALTHKRGLQYKIHWHAPGQGVFQATRQLKSQGCIQVQPVLASLDLKLGPLHSAGLRMHIANAQGQAQEEQGLPQVAR